MISAKTMLRNKSRVATPHTMNRVFVAFLIVAMMALGGCIEALKRSDPGSVRDLTSSGWVLRDMSGVKMNTDRRPTLKFDDVGYVNGFSGCNTYRGPLTVEKTTMSVEKIATTNSQCRIPVMAFEKAYIEHLGAVILWSIERNSLRLKDASGKTLLRFRRLGTPTSTNI